MKASELPESWRPKPPATQLTDQETGLLRQLMEESASVEVVQEQLSPGDLWEQLTICCRAFNYVDRATTRLKPVIGKILNIIQDERIYVNHGFNTFDEFVKCWVVAKMGMSRSVVFECKRLAAKWPTLSIEEYDAIGPTKVNFISRFTDMTTPGYVKYLKAAKELTMTGLVQWAEEQNLIEPGDTEKAVVTILTNRPIAEAVENFLGNPQVQSYCGTTDRGKILECAIAECMAGWLQQEEDVYDVPNGDGH